MCSHSAAGAQTVTMCSHSAADAQTVTVCSHSAAGAQTVTMCSHSAADAQTVIMYADCLLVVDECSSDVCNAVVSWTVMVMKLMTTLTIPMLLLLLLLLLMMMMMTLLSTTMCGTLSVSTCHQQSRMRHSLSHVIVL